MNKIIYTWGIIVMLSSYILVMYIFLIGSQSNWLIWLHMNTIGEGPIETTFLAISLVPVIYVTYKGLGGKHFG